MALFLDNILVNNSFLKILNAVAHKIFVNSDLDYAFMIISIESHKMEMAPITFWLAS